MTSELIARLERATAADQHVLIYDVLKFALEQNWIDQDTFNWAMQCRGIGAFLDAALTLVPDNRDTGIFFSILKRGRAGAKNAMACLYSDDNYADIRIEAATPALALCIAALRARGNADG